MFASIRAEIELAFVLGFVIGDRLDMSEVRQYALCDVRDEVQALMSQGLIGRHSRIYALCTFFNYRDWLKIERILEDHDFLLRDPVVELIGKEVWLND